MVRFNLKSTLNVKWGCPSMSARYMLATQDTNVHQLSDILDLGSFELRRYYIFISILSFCKHAENFSEK